jgi:cysteine desulfurase
MSLSAHKLYGPKGVGALYVRRGTRISSFLEGGEQEKGRRAGTLNVPGIVGFGAAAAMANRELSMETGRITELRDRLIDGMTSTVPGAKLSGSRYHRLSNNAHFCFVGVEGESLLLALDMAGICASAGSACSAGSTEPSHVLLAMGYSVERARGALRLTLGRQTSADGVDYLLERIGPMVSNLRSLSGAPEKL